MKKIALIISLIGIFILLILINLQEPKISEINSLSNKRLNEEVKIQGKIIDLKIFQSNFTITKIKDNSGFIEVICNCPQIKKLQNSTLQITGKLTEYQSNLQIQADKILFVK